MIKKKENYDVIFPGEHVAFIEEFESGKNTFVVDGSIRIFGFWEKRI